MEQSREFDLQETVPRPDRTAELEGMAAEHGEPYRQEAELEGMPVEHTEPYQQEAELASPRTDKRCEARCCSLASGSCTSLTKAHRHDHLGNAHVTNEAVVNPVSV